MHQLDSRFPDPVTDIDLKSDAFRARLSDRLQSMSLLSHILTRTRKRDVQEKRVIRQVEREAVEMNPLEREFYDLVIDAVRRYADGHSISDGFLLSMPCRQICSSPAAIARAWKGDKSTSGEAFEDLWLESDDDDDEPLFDSVRESVRNAVRQISPEKLEAADSKFSRLLTRVGAFLRKEKTEKLVIFTTFRPTARYLHRRLSESGLASEIIMGGSQEPKQTIIDRFRDSKTTRILVSTEVAAEGVDLQFCKVLVNYDLPWNPTKIEQRIGRIDRLGQMSEKIYIWNLFFADSIDDQIVSRLLTRLRIFEQALGESEAIVGEEVRKLEGRLFSGQLTAAEAAVRIDAAALALENVRIQRDELERNAPHMMAHGQRIIEKIDAARALSQRITEDDLIVYVRDYLDNYGQGHRFEQQLDDATRTVIQLPADMCAAFGEFLKDRNMMGKSSLSDGHAHECHFFNRISSPIRRNGETVHQFHPLIRFIANDLRARGENFYPLVALQLESRSSPYLLRSAIYAFVVYRWSFSGLKDDEMLATEAIALDNGSPLDAPSADALMLSARLYGGDWPASGNEAPASKVKAAFDLMDDTLGFRYREELERRKIENDERARFQLQTVSDFLERRQSKLQPLVSAYAARNLPALAKATQGRIDQLRARMNVRKEQIKMNASIKAGKHFVCAGIIQVR
jgi:hypothetical protein